MRSVRAARAARILSSVAELLSRAEESSTASEARADDATRAGEAPRSGEALAWPVYASLGFVSVVLAIGLITCWQYTLLREKDDKILN